MRRVLFFVSLICALPSALPAQQLVLPLHVGDRVKLAAQPGDRMETASVMALRDDAISIAFVGKESTIVDRPLVGIRSIHISQGASRTASAKRNAAFGAFVLGSVGAVVGPLAAKSLGWGIGQSIAAFGMSGALAGSSLGGAVGFALPREQWKTYVIRRNDEIAANSRP